MAGRDSSPSGDGGGLGRGRWFGGRRFRPEEDCGTRGREEVLPATPGGGHPRLLGTVLSVLYLLGANHVTTAAEGPPGQPGRLPVQSGGVLCDPMISRTMRSDARLWDVAFVDSQFGWAVGDRGSIWHTADGGRRWQLQQSGVSCPLRSVCFLDRTAGWAVGGWTEPYTHTSTGVVLLTRDGGDHWRHDPRPLLPALQQVRFFDARRGWAVGCRSEMFPSGLFVTEDGGRSWGPVPGRGGPAGWSAADLLGPQEGSLAGREGRTAVIRPGGAGIEPSRGPGFGPRGLHRITLVRPVYGWLVGDGGLVMMTRDLGNTWQTPPGDLPPGVHRQFDFWALAVRGPEAWIAGSPGTRVLHSRDAGQTWEVFATGQPLPIHALCFADDQHGWAVGELGTILATADGGRSWRRQRAGGGRAAMLGLFGRPQQVPLELFAHLAGEEGYLGVVELLARGDPDPAEVAGVPPSERLHEAVVGVGGSGAHQAWQFPGADPRLKLAEKQILAQWDLANDGRGWVQLEAHLVRQIRIWRPDVIVTCDADPADPLSHLVQQAVLAAVDRASDPTSFAEQITLAGLEPWSVRRVFGQLAPGKSGPIQLSTARLATRLGRSLADVAFLPRGLVEDAFREPEAAIAFRLARDRGDDQGGRQDFFAGIALAPGSEARRKSLLPATESLDALRGIAQKRRHTQAILARIGTAPQQGPQLAAHVGDLTAGLDPDAAAQTLYQLASQYARTGHWPLAAETFQLLSRQYPDHPLARPAVIWLVQYFASGEAAWRIQGPQRVTVQQTSAPALDFSSLEDRLDQAASLGKRLAATDPALAAQPGVAFALAAVSRRRGFPRDAQRFYLVRARSPARDIWSTCAQGERWLLQPQGLPPKPILRCARAPARPRLDAQLEDPVWAQAEAAELKGATGGDLRPAQVRLAYDDEFLYLAVRAPQVPGTEYPPPASPRPYDADLSDRDRIDLLIDLDRDFTTCYRLTIDHRGWTGEACWNDPAWNPTWFVAAGNQDGQWTAEAAIPLDQLTGDYPSARCVWAIGIQRIIPGVGFQSWNWPASPAGFPPGFGYLVFD